MTTAKAHAGRTAYLSGIAAEAAVERHYIALGLTIAARRWRGSRGEIDLIARDGDALVFIEVKASATHARAALHLTQAQTARLFAAASEFMATEPAGQNTPARFDVALIDATGQIEIIQNALIG